jgi:hypothetical protein
MNKPFKELSKEERVIVARARSRAMRAKAGVPVADKVDSAAGAVPQPAAAVDATEQAMPAVAADSETVADPMAELPPELLERPFKELTKEERVIVARARSRAMRVKAGLPVPGQTEAAPTAAAPAETAAEPTEEAAAVETTSEGGEAADSMAEVPPELLERPFKELTKEERVIVAKARSRAMRAKYGKPVGGDDA